MERQLDVLAPNAPVHRPSSGTATRRRLKVRCNWWFGVTLSKQVFVFMSAGPASLASHC